MPAADGGTNMAEPSTEELLDNGNGAPEPLDFLASSWHRFEVLAALADAPRTRDELMGGMAVSRPTLSRILSDLMDRGWIRRLNDEYEATPQGTVIADEVDQLVKDVRAAKRLGGALGWLRTDLIGFDLGHLADATVLRPTREDHTGPMRRLAERVDATDSIHCVANGVTYEVVEALCSACLAGELDLECVVDDRALEGITRHDDLRGMFHEMIDRGLCSMYRYTGEEDLLECNLLDDCVMLCGHSDGGIPQGIVVSEDETVRSWTAFYVDRLTTASEELGIEAFAS